MPGPARRSFRFATSRSGSTRRRSNPTSPLTCRCCSRCGRASRSSISCTFTSSRSSFRSSSTARADGHARSTGGSTSRTCRRSTLAGRIFRSCRFPTPSASPCRSANWVGTVHHGLPLDLLALLRPVAMVISRSSVASRRKSAPTAPSRSPRLPAAAPHGGQGRCRRPGVLPSVTSSRCSRARDAEFVGEIGDADKRAFLGRARRAAVPDRLARAVRARDDRGDGLRYPGHRVGLRLRARNRPARRDGFHRGLGRRGRRGRSQPRRDRSAPRACGRSSGASRTKPWHAGIPPSIANCWPRVPTSTPGSMQDLPLNVAT